MAMQTFSSIRGIRLQKRQLVNPTDLYVKEPLNYPHKTQFCSFVIITVVKTNSPVKA